MQTIAKKIFAVASTIALVLSAMPAMVSATVHAAGTNFVSNGTVYFINQSGQKQPYTSAGAFLSYGFNSWSNVVAASPEDLALPQGAFVPPMDGSLINDQGTVYLITNGQRAGFTSAANFTGLGYDWSQVLQGDTSWMATAAPISTTSMAHPTGTLVNQNGTVYLMTNSGKMGIPSLAVFNSWGYSFSKVVPANSFDAAVAMSSGIMNAMVPGQLNPTGSTSGTVVVPSSGGVSVSVDASTPAGSAIAKGSKVAFSRFDFTAGAQPAQVNSLVATRIGLSSDSDVSNVYLYDVASNTQLAIGSFNNGRVTFNTGSPLFTVNANSTKVIGVRADMSSTGTTGDAIGYGIASAADVNANGASVSGSFPVNGNLMTIAAVSNLGALNILSPASSLPSSINPGTLGANVGYFQLVGSNQPLSVSYIKLTNVGSVAQTDIQNIKLFPNGTTQVGATMQQAADKTVTFDLSGSPLIIPAGTTVNLWVRGDVVGGSNRNFQFTIQRTSDITVTDTTYNTGIVPTLNGGTAPIPSGTNNQVSVNVGSATLAVDAASPTGNIAAGAPGVTLGTFDFTSAGEDMRVSSITVTTTTTTAQGVSGGASDYLKNGKLLDVTNPSAPIQIGSTANLNINTNAAGAVATTFSVPGYWTVPAGTTRKLSVVADTIANVATNSQLNNMTLNVGITSVTAQGATSLSSITLGTATGRNVTSVTGSLTAATNAAFIAPSSSNPTGVPGQTGVRVGSWTLTAGPAEAVNVTQIGITSGSDSATKFQNLRILVNGTQVGVTQGALANSTLYTFTPSTAVVIPAGGAAVVDAYADILGSAATGASTGAFALTSVAATGAVDNASLSISSSTGQAGYIAASGTLTTSLDPQAPTTAQLQQLVMGSAQQTLGVFNLAASNGENINVTKVVLTDTETATNVGIGDFQNIKLYVNGTAICNGLSVPALTAATGTTATATFNLSSCPLVVPANSNISVYAKADITAYPNGTSGASHQVGLASSAVTSVGQVSGASGGASAAVTGVVGKVYRTALTIAKDASSPSGLNSASSTQTVGVYNLTNSANAANAQALILPTTANFNSALAFTVGGTVPMTASTTRVFTVYKATDLTTPVLQATLTVGTSPAATWNGTLTFTNTNGTMTCGWSGNTLGTGGGCGTVTIVPQTINAGQTVQYVVKFDTSDATTGKTMTWSINTQSNNMWADGATAAADAVTTMNGLPVTFGTLQY